MTLTAEEKNTTMSAERKFLTQLLESALQGDFGQLRQHMETYARQHNDNEKQSLSHTEIITQFRDGKKRTALHFACQSTANAPQEGQDIVERLLAFLPTTGLPTLLRLKDKDGLTPLMLAAQVADPALAQRRVVALLQSAGDGSKLGLARSHAGATAMHYAAGAGATPQTIQALYEAGQVAIQTSSLKGGTPLHWAVAVPPPKDYSNTIVALADCGADLHFSNKSSNGNSSNVQQILPPPIHMATAAGNDKHAKCLVQEALNRKLDLRPTLDYKLPGGHSIYHMLADMNWVSLLNTLVEQTPNMDSVLQHRSDEGLTAIELAAREKNVGPVLVLLGEGHSEEDAKTFIDEFHSKPRVPPAPVLPKPSQETPADDDATNKRKTKAIEEKALESAAAAASTQVSDEEKAKALESKKEGNARFGAKDWTAALTEYSKAIECDPTDATFYSNRSACYMMLNQPDLALKDAVIARTLRPEWPKAAYRMAVARLELGQFEDAAVSAFEGLKQDPDNHELRRLVQKCVKQGRKDHFEKKKDDADDN